MDIIIILYMILGCASNVFGLKLLLVFPLPGKSHYALGNELGKGLANAGHEVTMISIFEEPKPPKNYRQIVLHELLKIVEGEETKRKYNMFEMENIPAVLQLIFLNFLGDQTSSLLFEHPKVQALLKSKDQYDAVIVEQFWNDAMKVFAYHFKAPLILFSAVGPSRWTNNLIANPEPPSYAPDVLLSFTGEMSFFQRTYNFLFGLLSDLHLYLWFYPNQEKIMKKFFPNAPLLNEIKTNVSLVLFNSHESVNQPLPHVPNMIDIGGFHVNPPKEPPKDIQQFMDNSKDGVIYFSMGSTLLPSMMPKDKKDVLLKVLGSRKENILWKWDEDTLEDKPKNMMISKWFPQQAILAHPNCKLFITHGGLLSTIETIYMGVPVLALPIFGDQKLNSARAAALGYGKSVPFSQLNENYLEEVIDELLKNSSYRENAKRRSKIMHDRPVKPIDLAAYWIEYVVRHKGAQHLRVAGINLPLYKYYMLDVFGALVAVLVLPIYLLSIICRRRKSSNTIPKQIEQRAKSNKKRQ